MVLVMSLLMVAITKLSAYNLRRITNLDGLSSGSVTSLGQTPNGLMMFGTIAGLDFYDGSKVWTMKSDWNNAFMQNNLIEDIAFVPDDEIWVLTSHGLCLIINKGKHIKTYPQFKGIRRISVNENGEAFMLDDGILHYCDKKREFRQLSLPDLNTDGMRGFVVTGKYLYIFHQAGIMRYHLTMEDDEYHIGKRELLDRMSVRTACVHTGSIYLTDENDQLYRYDLRTGYKRPIISLQKETAVRGKVSDVLEFKSKLFIAFSNHGVSVLDLQKKEQTLTFLDIDTGIFRLLKDRIGDIVWIATDGQGVYMCCDEPYTQRSFTDEKMNIGVSCPIRTIYKDRNQTLWVGTKGDGLVMFPNPTPSTRTPSIVLNKDNSPLQSNVIFKLKESSKEGFWICCDNGLSYGIATPSDIRSVPSDMPIQQIQDVYEQDGKLWIISLGYGIYCSDIVYNGRYPQLVNTRHYIVDNGKISSNYFISMVRDKKGRWFFGNRGKGIFTIENDQLVSIPRWEKKYDNPLFYDIYALLPVGDDLWIGTGGGILVCRNDKITSLIDIEKGLPNNNIRAMIKGMDGKIWVTTNKGIAILSPTEEIIKVYGKKGELEILEYSGGAASLYDNILYLGGTNGVTIFLYDANVINQPHPLHLYFDNIYFNNIADNINFYLNTDGDEQTLRLNSQQRSFGISMTSLDYLNESTNNYYYHLSGSDEWIDNGWNNIITFTELSYGKHILYVKYKNLSTGEESPEFRLTILIATPWYRTTAAKFLILLLAIAVAWLLIHRWLRQQHERQLVETERQNQIARDKLYEDKLQFLTNVVHELNTPLTLIYGPCERILSHESSSSFVKKYVQQIIKNLQRLNILIQEIIDFRRITTGHLVIQTHRVNVSSLMEGYTEAYIEMAERYHIQYDCTIAKDVIWNSDERALARIGNNLISNAFKYTKPGGTIRVKFSEEDGNIVLSVYNTGSGISEEEQQHIFDYFSVFKSSSESSNGEQTSRNGIGMAICYNTVKLLGGSIKIDSKEGEYACFIVTLPPRDLPEGTPADQEPIDRNYLSKLSIFNSPVLKAPAVEKKPTRAKHFTGETAPTILLIDDNQEILDMVSDGLKDYHLLTAHNGDEGFERMKDEQPDLIITDLMMPGTDGLDFIQQVKQNRHTMHIPLIILSAKSSEEERIEGLESGADIYISKPFSLAYLQTIVVRLLENRKVLKEYYNSGASAFTYSSGKLISKEDQEFIDNLSMVMEKHLSDGSLTPETLASLLDVSLRNLYRKFESAKLPTPKEYIKTYKINAAARMLATTNITVQEIIYATGYSTRSQFYTEFKKHFGVTPKEYREQQHAGS